MFSKLGFFWFFRTIVEWLWSCTSYKCRQHGFVFDTNFLVLICVIDTLILITVLTPANCGVMSTWYPIWTLIMLCNMIRYELKLKYIVQYLNMIPKIFQSTVLGKIRTKYSIYRVLFWTNTLIYSYKQVFVDIPWRREWKLQYLYIRNSCFHIYSFWNIECFSF